MVPFFDLTRQYQEIHAELEYVIKRTLKKGLFTLGSEVVSFEREFAEYIGTKYAVGVASGTDALTLGLRALDLGSRDEVILPANAYPTAFGVALSGVRIRLADCDESGLLDPDKLEEAFTQKTKAIIPVHLYGAPCDLLQINRFIYSKKQKISFVEDAAQAHGAQMQIYKSTHSTSSGQANKRVDKLTKGSEWGKVGSFGEVGCFSFYPTKNLGAYGDGGMIVTDDGKIAEKARMHRMYGEKKRYESQLVSGVSRLDELQAAILRVKLRYLDQWNRRRSEIVKYYIAEIGAIGEVRVMGAGKEEGKSCHHLFVVRTKRRDALQAFLAKKGIGTNIHYPVPIHMTKSFANLEYKKGDFPVAEAMSREVLSLPLFPELTDGEVDMVVREVKRFFQDVA